MSNKILQLSNDFAYQKIYINLVKELSKLEFKQIVYVPVRWQHLIDGNRDDSLKDVEYYYSYILKRNILFRLRYFTKIKIILKDIESSINVHQIGLVHAHFMFSDGGVACLLKERYGIPYVVSVRSSDLFVFYKMMVHLRPFGNKIIKEADKVVFINPTYKDYFIDKYLDKAHQSLKQKMLVVPNAIDSKWFKNVPDEKRIDSTVRILYVGKVIKRKKLDVVISSVIQLNKSQKRKYILEVVGDGDFMSVAKKMANDSIIFHGKVNSFEHLLAIYRSCHIFAMPSIRETFGLVYIEALSQGLPIIYCKNEAVDGFFKPRQVGCAVAPNSVDDVINSVKYILMNYREMSLNAIQSSKKFTINENTNQFVKIYKETLFGH